MRGMTFAEFFDVNLWWILIVESIFIGAYIILLQRRRGKG